MKIGKVNYINRNAMRAYERTFKGFKMPGDTSQCKYMNGIASHLTMLPKKDMSFCGKVPDAWQDECIDRQFGKTSAVKFVDDSKDACAGRALTWNNFTGCSTSCSDKRKEFSDGKCVWKPEHVPKKAAPKAKAARSSKAFAAGGRCSAGTVVGKAIAKVVTMLGKGCK